MKKMNIRAIVCAGMLLLAPSFASAEVIQMCDGSAAGPYDISSGNIFNCSSFTQGVATDTFSFTFNAQSNPTGAFAASFNLESSATTGTATLTWYDATGTNPDPDSTPLVLTNFGIGFVGPEQLET